MAGSREPSSSAEVCLSESITAPKRPGGTGWVRVRKPAADPTRIGASRAESWFHAETGLLAVTASASRSDDGSRQAGTEYSISLSVAGSRCSAHDAFWVLAEFGMLQASEDLQQQQQSVVRVFRLATSGPAVSPDG